MYGKCEGRASNMGVLYFCAGALVPDCGRDPGREVLLGRLLWLFFWLWFILLTDRECQLGGGLLSVNN